MWLPALVALLVSAVVRAWVLHDLRAADPLLVRPYLDDRYYLEMAGQMAQGTAVPWFLAPLHPWIAARASAFATLDLGLLCTVNLVAGALTSAVVAAIGARLAGARAAWAAGLAHALLGVFVFHDVLPGQEPWIGLATAVVVLLTLALAEGAGPATAAGLGVAVGVAALGRGTSLALLLVPLPVFVGSKRRLALLLACVAGLCVTLAPAALRNHSVEGVWSPFPWSGGPNLYLGNGPDSRATVSMTDGRLGADPYAIERNALRVASAESGRELTPREASAWWTARTLEEARHSGDLALHVLRKAALFVGADERGSNHAAHAERDFATYTSFVPVAGWWLLAVGVAGWWIARRRHPGVDAPLLAIVATGLGTLVFFPVDRYRAPALVAAVPLVTVGVAETWRAWRLGLSRRVVVALVIAFGAAVIAHVPVREPDLAAGHVAVALGHLDQEGPTGTRGVEQLRRALDLDPDCGPANELLARIDLSRGLATDAFPKLQRAALDRRSRYSSQVAAVQALIMLGQPREAWRVAQGLLHERDDDPELLANAALAAHRSGDGAAAAGLAAAARRLAPGHPAVQRLDALLR